MIYRVLIDQWFWLPELSYPGDGGPPTRLGGADGGLFGGMGDTMIALGLPSPRIDNRRARFYFTEAGWRQVGRIVAAEAGRRGHVVRVIRRKQPRASQMVYRDDLQIALLPPSGPSSRRPGAALLLR